MFVRLRVKQKPKREPDKSERAGEDERRAPAPVLRDPWHNERGDDGAGVCAGVEDSGGESALLFGEPFGHALDAGGKNAGLPQSHREARGPKTSERTRGAIGPGRQPPKNHFPPPASAPTPSTAQPP